MASGLSFCLAAVDLATYHRSTNNAEWDSPDGIALGTSSSRGSTGGPSQDTADDGTFYTGIVIDRNLDLRLRRWFPLLIE